MWPYEPRLKSLQQQCPSKAQDWSWEAEINYRQFCKDIILNTGAALKLPLPTQHRAVVLLHRFFSRSSSAKRPDLSQWAVAVACLFLATKIDSAYHRLESVVHAAYVQLKHLKQEKIDRDYYYHGTDPVTQLPAMLPGNPAFLSRHAALARDAEMDLLFAVNFDFNIEVPVTMVIYELRELGLTEERAAREPAVKEARELAATTAAVSITHKTSVVCLRYAPRQVALAAISWACSKYGVPLDLGGVDGAGYTPLMTREQLQAVEKALPKPVVAGSKQSTPAPDSSAGGAAAAARNASTAAAAGAGARVPSSHGSGSASHTAVRSAGETQQQQQQQHNRHRPDGVSSRGVVKRGLDAGGISSQGAHNHGVKRARVADGSSLSTGGDGGCGGGGTAAVSVGQAVLGCSTGDGSACDAVTTGPRIAPSPISPDSETGPAAAGAAAGATDGSSKAGALQRQAPAASGAMARYGQQQQQQHAHTYYAAGPGRPGLQQQQQQQPLPLCAKRACKGGFVVA